MQTIIYNCNHIRGTPYIHRLRETPGRVIDNAGALNRISLPFGKCDQYFAEMTSYQSSCLTLKAP